MFFAETEAYDYNMFMLSSLREKQCSRAGY